MKQKVFSWQMFYHVSFVEKQWHKVMTDKMNLCDSFCNFFNIDNRKYYFQAFGVFKGGGSSCSIE